MKMGCLWMNCVIEDLRGNDMVLEIYDDWSDLRSPILLGIVFGNIYQMISKQRIKKCPENPQNNNK